MASVTSAILATLPEASAAPAEDLQLAPQLGQVVPVTGDPLDPESVVMVHCGDGGCKTCPLIIVVYSRTALPEAASSA
jgi:hypothetical protein